MFRVVAIIIVMLAIDAYAFKGIRLLTSAWSGTPWRMVAHSVYWMSSALVIGGAIYVFQARAMAKSGDADYKLAFYLFACAIIIIVPKLIFVIFHLVEDISYWSIRLIRSASGSGTGMTRFKFISQVGLALASIPMAALAYGVVKGRFDFRVIRETLTFSNLPKAFDGLKVVQISDLHLGSFFNNQEAVQQGIDMINELDPDLIFFTGDLVNNYSSEAEDWIPLFRQLKARKGMYSILGNHDYGDYGNWDNVQQKQRNLERVIQINREMGFNILLNEHDTIEIDGDKIGILGVENWGLRGFAQYGDLQKTARGSEALPFKILLSHDPSHWDAQVKGQTDIDLTLSGHTHGMQFGVEIAGIKWSPAKFFYPRWAGLYREESQLLYVNRGFGYIGYPGRAGIPPEITFLELRTA